jgi:hypothetical protein
MGLDIPEGAQLVRVAAARAEGHRKGGAWSWTVADAEGTPLTQDSRGRMMAIGSYWAMGVLVGKPLVWVADLFGDISLEPDQGRTVGDG